jgi:DNA-directed RNA polymerase III subunit RPC8
LEFGLSLSAHRRPFTIFEIVVCRDQLPLPYHHLKIGPEGFMTVEPCVLADLITHRFNDRVQLNVGLFVELYDIVRAYECKSLPDTPVAYVTAVFRYVVFNPAPGSVWEGMIARSSPAGVSVVLSFFKDVFVPYTPLPDGSEFDDGQELWTWSAADDDTGEQIQFAFAVGETVRFRVCEVRYQPEKPPRSCPTSRRWTAGRRGAA